MQSRAAISRGVAAAHGDAAADGAAEGSLQAAGTQTFLHPTVRARVAACTLSSLSLLLLIARNAFRLLDAVGGAGAAVASTRRLDGRAIDGLLRGSAPPGGGGALADDGAGDAAAAALAAAAAGDKEAVWACMQKEVVGFVSCLIRCVP